MHRLLRLRWRVLVLLCGGFLVCSERAVANPDRIEALFREAKHYEQQADWEKACDAYETLLRLQRDSGEARRRYQECLRRVWQSRRHKDLSYRKEVLALEYGQALRLYDIVRDTLLESALDKKKVDAGKLFRKGLRELDAALGDPLFCQQYLPRAPHYEIHAFRELLRRTWGAVQTSSRQEAQRHLREVALSAQRSLQLSPTVVIMEFACGACYALDEYTVYLTPMQLRELCHSLKTEVGVGLTLVPQDGKLFIQDVSRYSPAAELMPPLTKDDQLISIDRKNITQLPLDTVRELLEGPAGSTVVLELITPLGPRIVQLQRRPVFTASVTYYTRMELIGYLHIGSFQESTPQEVDAALAAMTQAGMKGLILDLRGNGGGLFESALEVARRFLSSGIIASTQHQDPKFNTVYHARNPAAFPLPLIVLIDGDTASAAEVLAGALKENQRARLVGQTTFGKGCTQCVLKLPNAIGGLPTGGLRVTVAKFYSPRGEPYSGRGIIPDVFLVPEETMTGGSDLPLDVAVRELERVLALPR